MTTDKTTTKEDFSVYRYFDRSFYGELLLFLIFGPLLVILWFITIYAYYLSGIFFGNFTRSAVYLTVTGIASLLFYMNSRRILGSRGIVVEKDRIVKRTTRGISALNYSDIVNFHYLRIPIIKGFLILYSEQGKLYIPLFVHKSQEMIKQIFRKFEKHGLFFENSSQDREHLYRDALNYNQTRLRRISTLTPLLQTLTCTFVFSTAVAVIFWQQQVFIGLLFGSGSLVFPLATYFITDKIISFQQSYDKFSTNREIQSVYMFSGFITLLFYMTAAILFRNQFFQ